jgi:proline dehydrogenase
LKHFDSIPKKSVIFYVALFNKIIATALPILPRWFVRPFANPYVAGETFEEAKYHIRALNEKGFKTTIDILGEHVESKEEARKITQAYCDLYASIEAEKLDCNVSIKPTHIGLSISLAETMANVHLIANAAKNTDNFLRLDMENSPYTDATFELLDHCKSIHAQTGIVLQAYLHRSMDDVHRLSASDFNVRICKGIYQESEQIAYQSETEISEHFFSLVQAVIKKSGYCAIATHDLTLVSKIESWVAENNIPKDQFEFQVLYGVPMEGRLESLAKKGYTVRIYVPFGSAWFDYSVRRLKENPKIISYVLKNFFKGK